MKRLRILGNILKRTHADKLLLTFVIFFFAAAFIIWQAEPTFESYGDSIWYCYVAIATIGFGDIVAKTFIGKLCTVLLSIYSILIIAVVTGIVVNYYLQVMELRQKETLTHFLDDLENLPEKSKEELEELSKRVKNYRLK